MAVVFHVHCLLCTDGGQQGAVEMTESGTAACESGEEQCD